MKTWLILAAVVVSFAVSTEAEAQWWPRRSRAFYGYGYPGYTTYYAPPVYVAPRPVVVHYRPVVVRPVAPVRVVGYPPVAYTTYYAPAPYYYCGW